MFHNSPDSQHWFRVTRMTWDELRTRTGQEFRKRWDANVYGLFSALKLTVVNREGSSGKFFFAPDELAAILETLANDLPSTCEDILGRAEKICRHEFDLLGYRGLHCGDPINWHLDAVSGKQAPRVPFYKVRYLDPAQVGDSKVVWELNRHQHLVILAKAYCLTRERRYIHELKRQWYDWREQNPYPIGINWSSSLEVAFRCLAWLWVRELLRASGALETQFAADVESALLLGGRHIERYLSTYFSPNTHLLGEAVALFFLGTLLGQGSTRRWKQNGWAIILEEARRQVQPDGMHFEQSTYYHVYACDFFLHARALAAANGLSIPAELDRTIERMLQALALLSRSGAIARFGDDDGGRLFDPRRNCVEHMSDPLCTGAILYGRPEFKSIQQQLIEETVWLLGSPAAAKFKQMPSGRIATDSASLQTSGIYVVGSQDRSDYTLIVDAGPQGSDGAGHGHADALSMQLFSNGRELLVDPGTYVYTARHAERQLFRGTAAHNTVTVDGNDQSVSSGPFRWLTLPNVRVRVWTAGEGFGLVVASHDGYTRLPGRITHTRWIFALKDNLCFSVEQIEGEGSHRLEVNWQCALGADVSLAKNCGKIQNREAALTIIPVESPAWKGEIAQSWYSPVYGCRLPTAKLTYSYTGTLPVIFATALRPGIADLRQAGVLHHVHADGDLHAFQLDTPDTRHLLMMSCSPHHWRWRGVSSDADLLYCETGPKGKKVIACGVTFLGLGDVVLLPGRARIQSLNWESGSGRAEIGSTAPIVILTEHLDSMVDVLAMKAIGVPGGS